MISPDGIGVAGEKFTVDAATFRDLAAPPHSGGDLTAALALWRGEPLGNADVPGAHRFHLRWAAQREALTELHRPLIHEHVDQLGGVSEATLWSRPERWSRCIRSMSGAMRVAQALTCCGRRLEARAYMSTARKALSSDVGVPPAVILTDIPAKPDESAAPMVRSHVVARPKLAVLPLQVTSQDDALQVTARHVVPELLLGLWQSGLCEVTELDWPLPDRGAPVADIPYVVRGSLTRLDGCIRLSLRCPDGRRGRCCGSRGSARIRPPARR
jgi:hypothetical protein